MAAETYLFVGLGNPGPEYEQTRHNVGFWAIDRLARAAAIPVKRHGFSSVWGEGRLHGKRLVLAKPQTYMNRSGVAVKAFVQHYRIEVARVWIFSDDLDLPTGRLRIRTSGGSGGHRGLASVIEQLGRNDFGRIRIGIGRPPAGADPAGYVLSRPGREERALLEDATARAVDAALLLLQEGAEAAMNRFN